MHISLNYPNHQFAVAMVKMDLKMTAVDFCKLGFKEVQVPLQNGKKDTAF